MSNPLVAAPVDMSTPFTGTFLLEDGEMLCTAIANGDWVSGGLSVFSAAMDGISMAVDPLGSLIAMGLGWVMEHLEPIKGWMNDLTGDAGEVAGFASTWTNIAAHLKETGADLVAALRSVEGMSGETIDAYRRLHGDASRHIEASAAWADGIAAGMQIASTIVKMVHDLTRDAIATIAGTAISAGITTVATLGFGAPVAVAQVTSKVASLAGKIGTFLTKLLRSIGQLGDLVKKLVDLFKRLGGSLNKSVPNAPKAPVEPLRPLRGGDGSTYTVAYQMSLDPSDWAKTRAVHFNRANADLDAAIKSDPSFAAQMEELSPGISDRVTSVGSRKNPNPEDFIWNHAHPDTVGGEHGVMQLVPTYQHTSGSPFWTTIHPEYIGGFAIWGAKK